MTTTKTTNDEIEVLTPKHRGKTNYVYIIASFVSIVAYVIASLLIAWVFYNMASNEIMQHEAVEKTNQKLKVWPTPDVESLLKQAREYNDSIDVGTTPVGEGLPLNSSNSMSNTGDGRSRKDKTYMSALNLDDNSGLMATISIPKISSSLKIYHTTDDDALSSGVGHLYGTDLPLGDKGDFTALAAHSGEADRLFFTRLGELNKGDYFYITVLGEEMGYQIDHIDVVNPDNVEALFKYQEESKNQARVTLITCTPVGINTQRLLVSGVRKPIPHPVPPSSTQKDWHFIIFMTALGIFVALIVIGLIVSTVIRYKRRKKAKHVRID